MEPRTARDNTSSAAPPRARRPRRTTSAPEPEPRDSFPQRVVTTLRRNLPLTITIAAIVVIALIAALVFSMQRTPVQPEAPAKPAPVIQTDTHIETSPALEMYVPSVDLLADFEEGACRVHDGAIDPASLTEACTYTDPERPYSLPGTDAEDLVVVAGHTGAGFDMVFDNLYDGTDDHHTVAMGDRLYLRTEASGGQWLVYRATDFHEPVKEGLAQDADVWGDSAMPGRLLTISCIQPANPLQSAVRNAVIGWQYEGVVNERPGTDPAAPTVLPAPYPGLEPSI